MYKDYFHLNEMPFSIAPDPRFLFMSERHREAMAHLLYGVQGEGGIVLLTGEVGAGKTTICRSLLEQIPENIDVAFILNPRMRAEDLLLTICEELHIAVPAKKGSIKTYIDVLNAHLIATHALGRRTILIVDEAQNLDFSVIEQLRLLTNLETNTRKLLQIFLIGQPELQNMLARHEMRQVAQRVVARYHLNNLNQAEVGAYITHRLRIAGTSAPIFPETLVKQIYRASNGVPRLINLICDRALLGIYVQDKQQVTAPIIRQAILEVFATTPHKSKSQRVWMIATGVASAVAGVAIFWVIQTSLSKPDQTAPMFATQPVSASAVQPSSSVAASSPVAASAAALSAASSPVAARASAELPITPLESPDNLALANSESSAFPVLFKLYGLEWDAQYRHEPCQLVALNNLRCYRSRGGLSDLFSLDQPVVIQLLSDDNVPYFAALTALDRQAATLVVGGEARRVSLQDLASVWSGEFAAIWSAPPRFRNELKLGQRDEIVVWMRRVLETVDGVPDDGSYIYDEALAKRVRAFQLMEGMQPDGVVGSRTLMRLNALGNKNLPQLVTDKKG
jgi:general secretion pathway protein A